MEFGCDFSVLHAHSQWCVSARFSSLIHLQCKTLSIDVMIEKVLIHNDLKVSRLKNNRNGNSQNHTWSLYNFLKRAGQRIKYVSKRNVCENHDLNSHCLRLFLFEMKIALFWGLQILYLRDGLKMLTLCWGFTVHNAVILQFKSLSNCINVHVFLEWIFRCLAMLLVPRCAQYSSQHVCAVTTRIQSRHVRPKAEL